MCAAYRATESESAQRGITSKIDVLVIGGGFGGTYALWKLRQQGLRVKLVEAGSELGGTWHWNQYPGARVDSEAPYYAFSIPLIWKTWNWTERFPSSGN